MRKSLLLAVVFTTMVHSQVLNDARVLLAGKMEFGLSAVHVNGNDVQSARIGIGVVRGADAECTVSMDRDKIIVGLNTEIALRYRPDISITLGGQYQKSQQGANAALTVSFPLNRFFSLYTGFTGNVILSSGSTQTPVWYFSGINSFLSRGVELFIEADPAIASTANTMFAGGLRAYF